MSFNGLPGDDARGVFEELFEGLGLLGPGHEKDQSFDLQQEIPGHGDSIGTNASRHGNGVAIFAPGDVIRIEQRCGVSVGAKAKNSERDPSAVSQERGDFLMVAVGGRVQGERRMHSHYA